MPQLAGWRPSHGVALDPRVHRMAFARAVNTLGLSLAMSFLGVYVVETRDYPGWLYGAIAMVANLGQSLSSAWAGAVSDRIGRRPLITGSLFIRSAVIAGLGTLVLVDAPLWAVAITMIASSSLRGGFEPVAYALVADVVSPDQRIAAFGIQRIATNLGWAIGPALGGLLTHVMPYGAVFYLAAGGMIAAGIVTLGVADSIAAAATHQAPELWRTLTAALRDPRSRALLGATLLGALLQTQMFSTLAIFLTDQLHFEKSDVGWIYMVNGVVVLVLQVPALAVIRRLGLTRVLPIAALINTLGFALIGTIDSLGWGLGVIAIITCGEVLLAPAHQAAIAECGPAEQRGRTFGMFAFAQMLGIAAAPLFGGILLDTVASHPNVMWLAIATLGVGTTGCLIAFVRRTRV